ncbi:hypothetical protein QDX25_10180 [Auritidibacter ignavus]|uniref:Uncharacterized protein n=1 Tax=Auritidibacter ignavus TaxID=678932 RepID=A0AAJ6AG48_9MICC|nr:hypothetical protein [Auritidibacter ignavus]WGH81142.1 hypothetical protein QDX25_10180 [Auritidibacter ignavus]WGH92705.1 hypothetical protein QDX21_10425 [Auritidibacter ignavus]
MSAATVAPTETATVPRANSFARVPAAFRLQFAVPTMLIGVPVMVFLIAWAIALGLGATIHVMADETIEDPIYTGAGQATLWSLGFMAAYAASHTFPFSLALSFSRRTFVIGAILSFAAVSAGFGLAASLMAWLERATDGLGFNTYVFDLPFLTQGEGNSIPLLGVVAALLCLVVMLFGFGVVLLYLRLGLARLWTLILSVIVVIAGAAILVTLNEGWSRVWEWLVQQNALSISGWLLLVAAVQSVVTYLMIRKATSRG